MKNNLPNIKERILYLSEKVEVSKQEFFRKIDITYGNFTGSKKNRPVNSDAIENILLNYPQTNPEWLLIGKGEMLKSDTKSSTPLNVIEINPESKLNTLVADVRASAGFGEIVHNEKKLEELPAIALPDAPLGLNIAFQINGDSMHPTIRHLDYVAGNQVHDLSDIREGHVYIIVDREDGVLCKRLYQRSNGFNIVSDNPIYKPYHRNQEDIVAIFRAFARLSYDFRNYHDDIRTIVQDHENRITLLEDSFQKHKII